MSRPVLALVLLLAIAAVIAALSHEPERVRPQPQRPGQPSVPGSTQAGDDVVFERSDQCRDCHEEVYGEWEQSYHAMAWTDPMVQALSKGFRMTECIDCHAPQPIHLTGVQERVAPRSHDRKAGVDCLTCHLLPDGRSVAAGRDVDTSATSGACRPKRVPEMGNAPACSGCHNQHATLDELTDAGVDKTCLDCHMEPTDRGGRAGRSHLFPGCHEPEMHRRAAKLSVSFRDGQVIARVTNVGGGHKIPTDARHRSYNLWLEAWDARGNLVQKEIELAEFRLYYRDDFKPSTQIAHGESGEGRWQVPAGLAGKARVRLTYALNPELLAARDLIDVHAAEVAFQ